MRLPITRYVADHTQHVSHSAFSGREASTNFISVGFTTCCKKSFSCETVAVVATCGNKNVQHKSNDV